MNLMGIIHEIFIPLNDVYGICTFDCATPNQHIIGPSLHVASSWLLLLGLVCFFFALFSF